MELRLATDIIDSLIETLELMEDKAESEYFYLLDSVEIDELKEVA